MKSLFALTFVIVTVLLNQADAINRSIMSQKDISLPPYFSHFFSGNFSGQYSGDCTVEFPEEMEIGPIDDCELNIHIVQNESLLESIEIDTIVYGMELGTIGFSEHIIDKGDLIDPIDGAYVGKIDSKSFSLSRSDLGILRMTHLFGNNFEVYAESSGVIDLGAFIPNNFILKAKITSNSSL